MEEFLVLCRRLGHLDELVQAGGGNISVKVSDTLSVIKASGVALSDVTRTSGWTLYDHAKLTNNLDQPLDAVVVAGPTPSLETYFHAFMGRIVVHLHPTALLPALCKADVPNAVPYRKPGIDLAREIRSSWTGAPLVLLQNHGIVVTGDTVNDVLRICDQTYEAYRTPRFVPLSLMWKVQDEFPTHYVYRIPPAETEVFVPVIRKYNIRPLTPDIALFLHGRVQLEGDYLFVHAPTKPQCLAIVEVLRSYCEVVSQCSHALAELDVAAILHWPAELKRKAMP